MAEQHPTLLLAEQLEPDAIFELNHSAHNVGPAFAAACTGLEVVLRNPKLNLKARLREANARFVDCASTSPVVEAHRSRLLLASWPLFELRAANLPFTQPAFNRLHMRLSRLTMQIPFRDDPNSRGAYYEAITHALAADQHIPLFPSTAREEAGAAREDRINHDSYLIVNWLINYLKLPFQIRGALATGGSLKRRFDPFLERFYVRTTVVGVAMSIPDILPGVDFRNIKANTPPVDIADALLEIAGRLTEKRAYRHKLNPVERLFIKRLSYRLTKQVRRRKENEVRQRQM